MVSDWSISKKLLVGAVLLFCAVAALSVSSFVGIYAFRSLAKSIRLRAPELPASSQLAQDVSKLRVTYKLYKKSSNEPEPLIFEEPMSMEEVFGIDEILVSEFDLHLSMVTSSFKTYSDLLTEHRASDEYRKLRVDEREQRAVDEFETLLSAIRLQSQGGLEETLEKNSIVDVDFAQTVSPFEQRLTQLEELSKELPRYLHDSMHNFADEARGKYRSWMVVNAILAFFSLVALIALLRLCYAWVFRPLRILLQGSRRVANGDFDYQIQLDTNDEIAELADAMNSMTGSFREIRDDLNRKVQQKTKEVVRGEQLASVGFLAAGVAHEINNPLASIALCAESLEQRFAEEDLNTDEDTEVAEPSVVRQYLKMIQDEAFRCKEITERLLDFSRLGDVEKHSTNLTELTESVIRMIKHLGKYKEKEIELLAPETVIASVNAQEIKQVLLNLITNALDSLDPGGRVSVTLKRRGELATLTVKDNGCGMTDEVQKNLFEPFFTRRRDGQGTGLGMSITYRIVTDHGGDIEPHSAGPGTGSTFIVSLPLTNHDEKQSQKRQAA